MRKSKCSISPYASWRKFFDLPGVPPYKCNRLYTKRAFGTLYSYLQIKSLQCNLSFSSSLDVQSSPFIRKKDKHLMCLVTVFYRHNFWRSKQIIGHYLRSTYGSLLVLLSKPRSAMNVMGAWTLLPIEILFWPPGTNCRAYFWSREKEAQGPLPHTKCLPLIWICCCLSCFPTKQLLLSVESLPTAVTHC